VSSLGGIGTTYGGAPAVVHNVPDRRGIIISVESELPATVVAMLTNRTVIKENQRRTENSWYEGMCAVARDVHAYGSNKDCWDSFYDEYIHGKSHTGWNRTSFGDLGRAWRMVHYLKSKKDERFTFWPVRMLNTLKHTYYSTSPGYVINEGICILTSYCSHCVAHLHNNPPTVCMYDV
jgi:hypothetical protein